MQLSNQEQEVKQQQTQSFTPQSPPVPPPRQLEFTLQPNGGVKFVGTADTESIRDLLDQAYLIQRRHLEQERLLSSMNNWVLIFYGFIVFGLAIAILATLGNIYNHNNHESRINLPRNGIIRVG